MPDALTVGSLFTGIGGFDLGLERAGMRVLWQCEQDEFCQRVLAKHWPDVPCYSDVTKLEGGGIAAVDVLCGGFPCQDISLAGKGAGIGGARSGLWSEYARLIGELRPRYVVVENVAALLARGMGRVLGDLATLGYDAEWDCIPASALGAPHRRDRLWIVAYPRSDDGGSGRPGGPAAGGARQPVAERALQVADPARDAAAGGAEETRAEWQRAGASSQRSGTGAECGCPWDFIDADGFCACCDAHLDDPRGLYAIQGDGTHRLRGCAHGPDADRGGLQERTQLDGKPQEHGGRAPRGHTGGLRDEVSDADLLRRERPGPAGPAPARRRLAGDEGAQGVADAEGEPVGPGLRESESRGLGRGRPGDGGGEGCQTDEGRPADDAVRGRHGAPEGELRAGRDGSLGAGWWSVEPDVGRVADGVPARVDRLRGLGNALVPQIAEWLGHRIAEYERA